MINLMHCGNYLDEEMNAIAHAVVKSAADMDAKAIILITMSGKTVRAMALHKPSVPVLAFCTDIRIARQFQLHCSVKPILLQSKLDPGSSKTGMASLRAESVRTAKELGIVMNWDKIVTMDRSKGKGGGMFG